MRFFLFLLFSLSLTINSFSQKDTSSTSFTLFSSLNHKYLTNKLTKNCENDSLKIIAIYNWVTHNIKYDYNKYYKQSLKYYKPNKTLRKRKGVCQHIAELFQVMCNNAGIDCILIPGYSKELPFYEETTPYWTNHIWNAVNLNGKWYLVEPTYGNGDVINYEIRLNKLLYRFFKIVKYRVKTKIIKQDSKYCFYPADSSITKNLPVIPQYQFLTPQLPLEQWIESKDSNLTFINKKEVETINTLSYRPSTTDYDAYFLELGQHALTYNPYNHREIAYPCYRILKKRYKTYKKKIHNTKGNFNYQYHYLDSLESLISIGSKASVRYKTETYKYHSNILKHNKIRHKRLFYSARGKYSYYKSRWKRARSNKRYYHNRAARSENGIVYLIKKHNRRTADDLGRTLRKGNLDSAKSKDKYIQTKFIVDSLNSIVTLHEDTAQLYLDSISIGKNKIDISFSKLDSISSILDSLYLSLIISNSNLSSNSDVFKINENINQLHLMLKQEQKTRDLIYRKQVYPYLKRIRSHVSKAAILHTRAKRIIKNLKRASSIYFNENSLYQQQNKEYTKTLNYLEESIERLIDVANYNARIYKNEMGNLSQLRLLSGYNVGVELARNGYIINKHNKERNINRSGAYYLSNSFKNYSTKIKQIRLELKEKETLKLLREESK